VKYVSEFRDPILAQGLTARIQKAVTRPWTIMEICGGQTHTIVRHGLDELLPNGLELVHGPGCPVCVTATENIDRALAIAARPEVIFTTYGDMLRVPGSSKDLYSTKARGADVRVVYSPADALTMARLNPERQVVFFGVGFETTAPAHAMTLQLAKKTGLKNFSMLVSHVLVPPAIRAILSSPSCRIQGFIAPGHVCAVQGCREYEDLAREFTVPIVVGGFEPIDLLEAIAMLAEQLEQGRAVCENQYVRSVTREGNRNAQASVREVFEVAPQVWRGIGMIPGSGLQFREEYKPFDAALRFAVDLTPAPEHPDCISAQIMMGLKKPWDCTAFATRCTPDLPLGAPMVSNEGACAAYYRYKRHTHV
jgi:hydrogenase expression/formation protein HypD